MAIVEVKDLVKRYDGRAVVDRMSFSVEEGEIFAILGPNGAGKTTTVEIIEGLRAPDAGTVSVMGLDPQRDHGQLRQRLGAQLQASRLPAKLKVREALELYSSFYPDPADADRLLEQLGLSAQRNTAFEKLSGGQQQRLSALGVESRVLVLTTYDTESDVLPAIEAGATGYLLKDAPSDELLRAVGAASRGEAVLSPSVASQVVGRVRRPAEEPLSPRELRGARVGRARDDQPADRRCAVHPARPPSRRICCISTASLTSTTARPPWPPPSSGACSSPGAPAAEQARSGAGVVSARRRTVGRRFDPLGGL